jgi:two-component system chemotaxis sensor kinase CheA
MGEYTFSESELNDLKEIFFTEAFEILQSLDQEILNLESGQDLTGPLRNIQRHLHTLKGNSRALGFTGLNALSHKTEDLLKAAEDSCKEVDRDLIDLLFEVNDQLQSLVDSHRSKRDALLDESLLKRIENALQTLEFEGRSEKPEESISGEGASASVYDIDILFDQNSEMKTAGANMILERLGTLGEIIDVEPTPESGLIEGTGTFRVRLGTTEPMESLKEVVALPQLVHNVDIALHGNGDKPRIGEKQAVARGTENAVQTLKVDALRVDKILNLVGELVIGRSMVGQVLSEIGERYKKDDLLKKLGDANAFMEKTLSQLQKNVMKIRMHPISQIFRKFPRVVRDLSLEQKKQVQLVMHGGKTELDKSILDVIGEPLIHLVRNAVDHGIEPPDVREQAGKPRTGTITLQAAHESNQIVIQVMDDGKGLDTDMVRKKSVEKGIKTPEEAARLSDDETIDLIFSSGFSTAEEVTDISGRGFGMDIVRMTVESLKGRIQINSKMGEGTTFTLRLPLTLAIIRAMLFWVDDRLLALPMSSIEKIARVRDSDIQTMAGKSVVRYREQVISVISLEESLKIRPKGPDGALKKFLIVVSLGNKLYGFAVDRLVGQQELVIKVLDNHWGTINCTTGASILGNGRVVLILDAPSIIMKELRREFIRAY